MINVIIPAYNCSSTIDKTLSSLVAQTDTNFEVIVVDDCSTENIKSIIDDYIPKLNIIYIRNEQNIGCGMSRQVGIDNATQPFITFLDSDDMFMPYTVETFNSIVEKNPNIQYLHSYFYGQIEVNEDPILYLYKDNYTACHGKLYNIDALKKFDIHNSPEVRWADDSFFNSMCSELLEMSIIRIPTVLYTNTKTSILRKVDSERDKLKSLDFLNAMILSTEHVLKYKSSVSHLKNTINHIHEDTLLTCDEKIKYNKLVNLIGGNYNGI